MRPISDFIISKRECVPQLAFLALVLLASVEAMLEMMMMRCMHDQ